MNNNFLLNKNPRGKPRRFYFLNICLRGKPGTTAFKGGEHALPLKNPTCSVPRQDAGYKSNKGSKAFIIFLFLIGCFFNIIVFASPTGSFYINTITTSTGYFSFKIHSVIPGNNYSLEGMPTNLPYIIQRINNFIANNLQNDPSAYIEFGFSDGINSTKQWFTTPPCRIALPNNESVSVTINSETSCQIS